MSSVFARRRRRRPHRTREREKTANWKKKQEKKHAERTGSDCQRCRVVVNVVYGFLIGVVKNPDWTGGFCFPPGASFVVLAPLVSRRVFVFSFLWRRRGSPSLLVSLSRAGGGEARAWSPARARAYLQCRPIPRSLRARGWMLGNPGARASLEERGLGRRRQQVSRVHWGTRVSARAYAIAVVDGLPLCWEDVSTRRRGGRGPALRGRGGRRGAERLQVGPSIAPTAVRRPSVVRRSPTRARPSPRRRRGSISGQQQRHVPRSL